MTSSSSSDLLKDTKGYQTVTVNRTVFTWDAPPFSVAIANDKLNNSILVPGTAELPNTIYIYSVVSTHLKNINIR